MYHHLISQATSFHHRHTSFSELGCGASSNTDPLSIICSTGHKDPLALATPDTRINQLGALVGTMRRALRFLPTRFLNKTNANPVSRSGQHDARTTFPVLLLRGRSTRDGYTQFDG